MFKPSLKNTNQGRISSLESLSRTLSIPIDKLIEISDIPVDDKYLLKEIPKADGSTRHVYKLHPDLRLLQSRINSRIFRELIVWPDFLFGSIPNDNDPSSEDVKRDYISCAGLHCQAKTILKVDIKDFFDNIHEDLVKDIFSNVLNIEGKSLEYLTQACCRNGFIVQGALTSSYIASLCLFDMEGKIVSRARKKNLVYTRLVDDITVSSKISNYDFSQIRQHIESMLAEKDLPINNKKTKVFYSSTQPLYVHGLIVDYSKPRLPSDEVKKIRASLNNISKLAVKNNSRTSVAYRKEYNRCFGKIGKLKRVGHNKYEIFLGKIKKIKPMPSLRDVKMAKATVKSLEVSHAKGNNNKYWFKRKYDLARYKIVIINRTKEFELLVAELRERMKNVKPNVER